jgi:uncharacterized membrane protein YfcA
VEKTRGDFLSLATNEIGIAIAALVLLLSFTISILSGFLGIGGGIVMAPALLYLPPIFGMGSLDMKQVTGLTITQALIACLSGAMRHDKYRNVNRKLVVWMGGGIVLSALAGSTLSRWIANEVLMVVFAGLAAVAAVLMCFPYGDRDGNETTDACTFNRVHAVLIAVVVGLFCGAVGQGGSFILIPLMLYALRLPTRTVIGSNLALVSLSSLAGFMGKLVTGQIPFLLAAMLVVGAFPGAQIGSVLSQRTRPQWLRTALAVVIGLAAMTVVLDVISGGRFPLSHIF